MGNTWTYPSVNELERIAAAGSGRDYARERREDRAAMEFCDALEQADAERAADHVEEALAGYRDPLTGLPPEGMEGPRFRTERERAYMDWVTSRAPGAARTRAIRHPKLEARMQRAGNAASEPASFAQRDLKGR